MVAGAPAVRSRLSTAPLNFARDGTRNTQHLTRMNYWLVKSEPDAYAWATFVKDGRTAWTGVRSFPARLHLRAMKKGDTVFFYHSNEGKEVVGVAQVVKGAYVDPTAEEGDWSCVDLKPLKPLAKPVTLEQIKADSLLKDMALVKQSRLSVMPVTSAQANRLLKLGSTPE
jgi:predicted RNA-binding protein with PUA-like domain